MVGGESAEADGPNVEPYINPNTPFGPVASEQIRDRLLRHELFDRENRAYAHLVRHDPAFVIGRRGAGKTSFLHAVANGGAGRGLVVTVDTSTAVAEVEELHRNLLDLKLELLADHLAKIWDAALWHHVLLGLILTPPDGIDTDDVRYDAISVYLYDLADRSPRHVTHDEIFGLFCERFLEQAMTRRSISRNPFSIVVGDTVLAAVIESASGLLDDHGLVPVLLMDSIEDFKRVLAQHTESIGALFAQVGRSGQPEVPYRIRFSFPAELFHELQKRSHNPMKDFPSSIALHWNAREIVRIAAHRYTLYLEHFHPKVLERDRNISSLNVERQRDAIALLRHVLPDRVVGELGIEEDSIAYVLRHTQLLPRHLLRTLNAIWLREPTPDGAVQVSPEAVIQGVRDVEGQIVAEICRAYELVHPAADEVCRAVVKNLPRRFSDAQLHRAFNQVGKGALKRANQKIEEARMLQPIQYYGAHVMPEPNPDYQDFKAMLVEIGCIGRLLDETERYHQAEFEYTAPNRLGLSDDDDICVHPLFSGVYQSRPDAEIDRRAVYPYGTDLEDDRPR